jgi:hypothetical protein
MYCYPLLFAEHFFRFEIVPSEFQLEMKSAELTLHRRMVVKLVLTASPEFLSSLRPEKQCDVSKYVVKV